MEPEIEKLQVSQVDKAVKDANGNNDDTRGLNGSQTANEMEARSLRLDKYDLPLVPQPSQHKDDPLVSTPKHITSSLSDCERTGLQSANYL